MTIEQLNNPEEWAAILAHREGKPIQTRVVPWDGREWIDDADPVFDALSKHRVKPEPEPKRRVPLGPEDVKPGDAVRCRGERAWKWSHLRPLTDDAVLIDYPHGEVRFATLQKDFEISHDHGVTWAKCEKEEK